MTYPAIALKQLEGVHSEITFNEVIPALAKAALFGVKQRETQGLTFTVYGGVLPTDSGPITIADQTITLTPSATNYISASGSGVLQKVTVAPTGWPGPLGGGRALYELVVGANDITSGTCWNIFGGTGPTGAQGPTGAAGDELWKQRKRICQISGHGIATFTSGNSPGFEDRTNISGVPGSISAGSSTFIDTIVQGNFGSGAGPNAMSGIRSANNLFTRGNAAGRGGFDVTFRFGCTSTSAGTRVFVGLFDCSGGNPSVSVDPSAFTNIIGVGGDSGETNLSFMVNDASGTATKTALGANFPMRGASGPNTVYEIRLYADANASTVSYTIDEITAGNSASGVASSDLPANTAFLGWLVWVGTGTSSGATVRFMQVAGNSRY